MTAAPPSRPWWKRKRWRAVIAAWLLLPVAYPVSIGPVIYAHHRGWIPLPVRLVRPAFKLQRAPVVGRTYAEYLAWWDIASPATPTGRRIGARRAAAD